MHVGIDRARCDYQTFPGKDFSSYASDHLRVHAVHDIRVATLPNSLNKTVLDANVGLQFPKKVRPHL